jgi:hypothetical protein
MPIEINRSVSTRKLGDYRDQIKKRSNKFNFSSPKSMDGYNTMQSDGTSKDRIYHEKSTSSGGYQKDSGPSYNKGRSDSGNKTNKSSGKSDNKSNKDDSHSKRGQNQGMNKSDSSDHNDHSGSNPKSGGNGRHSKND